MFPRASFAVRLAPMRMHQRAQAKPPAGAGAPVGPAGATVLDRCHQPNGPRQVDPKYRWALEQDHCFSYVESDMPSGATCADWKAGGWR